MNRRTFLARSAGAAIALLGIRGATAAPAAPAAITGTKTGRLSTALGPGQVIGEGLTVEDLQEARRLLEEEGERPHLLWATPGQLHELGALVDRAVFDAALRVAP